jgi:hypothetical protein
VREQELRKQSNNKKEKMKKGKSDRKTKKGAKTEELN